MEQGKNFPEQVAELIRSVPRGRVTTYGAIARALARPAGAREVGRALSSLPADNDVPTHRVVSAKGDLLCPRGLGSTRDQHGLLEQEGVRFDQRGRVRMEEYIWEPPEASEPMSTNVSPRRAPG